MFKYWSIKKYGLSLQNKLIKRYSSQKHFTAHQVRSTVYQCNFNPKYLPLAYLLYLTPAQLTKIMTNEFPDICISHYKNEILTYLDTKKYQGFILALQQT